MTQEIHYSGVRRPESVDLLEDGVYLGWRYSKEPRSATLDFFRPTDRALLEFTKLASDESIAAYASKYGVLEAIRIKPESEMKGDLKLSDGSLWRLGSNLRYGQFEGAEPLALWRGLASQLAAILRINAALKGRTKNPLPQIGTETDWNTLGGGPPLEDVRDAQFFLMLSVNEWLMRGNVRLELGTTGFSKDKTAWNLEISFDGLAGGLAYRLLLMVVGESRLYACDGCGRPYIRLSRAPNPGQENFCEDCTPIAKQRAIERYRDRKRRKRR